MRAQLPVPQWLMSLELVKRFLAPRLIRDEPRLGDSKAHSRSSVADFLVHFLGWDHSCGRKQVPGPPNGWQMVCGMTDGCFWVLCQPFGGSSPKGVWPLGLVSKTSLYVGVNG